MSRILGVLLALGLVLWLALGGQTASAADNVRVVKVNLSVEAAFDTAQAGATGSGNGTVTYNSATNTLSWSIDFSGTHTPVIGAHFHGPATPSESAGIQVDMSADLISPIEGSDTISEAQEDQLLAGRWYVNIHTDHSPGGEIRGQVAGAGGSPIGGVAELPDLETLGAESAAGGNGGSGLALAITIGAVAAVSVAGSTWVVRRNLRRS